MHTCGSYPSKTNNCAVGKITCRFYLGKAAHGATNRTAGGGTHKFTLFQSKRNGKRRERSGSGKQREATRSNEKQPEIVYIMNEHGSAWTNMD